MNATASRRAPTGQWLLMGLLAAAIVLGMAVAAVAWYRVAHELSTARPVKVPTIRPVSGVVWGGRVFQTRGSLAAWLRSRGVSYAHWAAHNPALARVLEPH